MLSVLRACHCLGTLKCRLSNQSPNELYHPIPSSASAMPRHRRAKSVGSSNLSLEVAISRVTDPPVLDLRVMAKSDVVIKGSCMTVSTIAVCYVHSSHGRRLCFCSTTAEPKRVAPEAGLEPAILSLGGIRVTTSLLGLICRDHIISHKLSLCTRRATSACVIASVSKHAGGQRHTPKSNG